MSQERIKQKFLLIASMLFLVFTNNIFAEIHPKYYKEMQESAPEQYRIKVLDVDSSFCILWCFQKDIEIEAQILEVFKSKMNAQKDQKIKICYTYTENDDEWVGPRPIPILNKDKKTRAYLRPSETKCLEPAARGASFEEPIILNRQ